jgi:hypothetical protein
VSTRLTLSSTTGQNHQSQLKPKRRLHHLTATSPPPHLQHTTTSPHHFHRSARSKRHHVNTSPPLHHLNTFGHHHPNTTPNCRRKLRHHHYRTTQQRSHLSKRGTNQPASKGPAPPPTSPSSTSDLRHKTQQQHPNGFYDLNPKTVTKNQQHTPQRYRGGVTHKTRQENERNQNGHKNPDPHLKTA